VYLIGDIEKDTARLCIERLRELSNDNTRPISLYINSAGGNVTDGLAIHDVVRHIISRGIEVSVIVQGMAYSMGSIVLQAASEGKRLTYPHSWIMIHEPAKWAGWQSTTAQRSTSSAETDAGSDLRILSSRSGKPLRQIIKDTNALDFYLTRRARSITVWSTALSRVAGAEAGSRRSARRAADGAPPGPAESRRAGGEERAGGRAGGRKVKFPPFRPFLSSWKPAIPPADARHSRRPNGATVPAERARAARRADQLIQGQGVSEGSHLAPGLLDRHVPHIGTHGQIRRDRRHDVVHALVAFVVGVVHARGVLIRHQTRIQIRQIAIVNERPVVVAVAYHTYEAVGRRLEEVADDAVTPSIHDARSNNDGAKTGARRAEDQLLVVRPPGHQRDGVDRRILGRRLRRRTEHLHSRCVDDEPLRGRRRSAVRRRFAPMITSSAAVDGRAPFDVESYGMDMASCASAYANDSGSAGLPTIASAARGNARRFLIVAHERRDIVTAAHERVEYSPADVSCRAGQKDSHRGRIS
jgi:ATP-dependent Clp protease protease subunit